MDEGVRAGILGEWSPEASPTARGGELNLSSALMCCEQTKKQNTPEIQVLCSGQSFVYF